MHITTEPTPVNIPECAVDQQNVNTSSSPQGDLICPGGLVLWENTHYEPVDKTYININKRTSYLVGFLLENNHNVIFRRIILKPALNPEPVSQR